MAAPDYFDDPATTESLAINSIADALEVQDDEPAQETQRGRSRPPSSLNLHSLAGTFDPAKNVAADPSKRRTLLDMRILDGKRVTKKGKVLDYEGRIMGELSDGEAEECAGGYVNEMGEVFDRRGQHVGLVRVVAGEAACSALRELEEDISALEKEQSGAGASIECNEETKRD